MYIYSQIRKLIHTNAHTDKCIKREKVIQISPIGKLLQDNCKIPCFYKSFKKDPQPAGTLQIGP